MINDAQTFMTVDWRQPHNFMPHLADHLSA